MRRRSMLLASAVPVFPSAFFNTMAGSTLWICATPQNADLTAMQFAALAWVQVKGVGSHGQTGTTTNILTYDTWDTTVDQKAKGRSNAGDPQIELARTPTDPGQIILRAAAQTNFNYAFKIIRNDANPGGQGTIRYNRGLVTGPMRPEGRNEDFDLEQFMLALNQKEIVIDPTSGGVAPLNTAVPTITGTPTLGQTLTATTGTFTGDAVITYNYQWYSGGQIIPGAINSTYVLTANEVGEKVNVVVYATNGAGNAQGVSAPTANVAAS